MKKIWILALVIGVIALGWIIYRTAYNSHSTRADTGWAEYNGDGARSHYSGLAQIDSNNVKGLKVAWAYKSGGADTTGNHSQMQCNPIIIGNVLYGVSANTQAFAIDAVTGREIWKTAVAGNGGTSSRGITYFADSVSGRIFWGAGRWLYSVDARTGKPVLSFGNSGRIDLKKGLERPGADNYAVSNTPNTIFRNLIITGVRVSESETALLGDIRAYNVYTGKLVWTFATIPAKGDSGYTSWLAEPRSHVGAANSWAGMAIDRERGIVYAPTGSAAFDFYGGNRTGDNLFANCLLALDAATGKRLWHFQMVHHDIWDRDPPAPPNLLTVTRNGKKTDAVAQVTKQGLVFVFNRVTGEPLFHIEEKPFPQDAVEGEHPSPTQPIPTAPEPFTRQAFTQKDINPFAADRDTLKIQLAAARTGSPYIPVGKSRTIIFPGTDGGAQWGGAAADPDGVLYVPAKEIPCYTTLVSAQPAAGPGSIGSLLYADHCAACHGKDRAGSYDGTYPSLVDAGKKISVHSMSQLLESGRGMMPSFSHLAPAQKTSLIAFIRNNIDTGKAVAADAGTDRSPYRHTGYNRWYDKNGYPVNTPPWGTLTAIDLNSGKRRWQVALGEYPELTSKGIPATGTDNYGGPLVTRSGLIFIAATRDEKFRAFDAHTGKLIWQTSLPAAGYASPSTYSVNGKQYIVIACGGGKLNTKSGDQYIAFTLD